MDGCPLDCAMALPEPHQLADLEVARPIGVVPERTGRHLEIHEARVANRLDPLFEVFDPLGSTAATGRPVDVEVGALAAALDIQPLDEFLGGCVGDECRRGWRGGGARSCQGQPERCEGVSGSAVAANTRERACRSASRVHVGICAISRDLATPNSKTVTTFTK